MTLSIEQAVEHEWTAASQARRDGDLDRAFNHLERAHILTQRLTRLHVRSHVGMLAIGWQRRDGREVAGQLARIVAALLFSRLWIPEGNSGGANVSAFRSMPLPSDLAFILSAADDAERDAQP